jgi:hypothetical protein
VGRPTARNLKQIYPRFEVSGIVGELDLKSYRGRYAFGTWLPRDWESPAATLLPENTLKRALIVCSGVLEQLDNPVNLLSNLKRWLAHSPACILTLANGTASESRQLELEQLLRNVGLNVEFVGLTATDNASSRKDTSIAVIANNAANAGGTPAVPVIVPRFTRPAGM